MDFALSSSMVLGAAVLLWLVWVAPYLLRRMRAERPAGESGILMNAAEDAPPLPPPAVTQEAPEPSEPSPGHAVEAPSPAEVPRTSKPPSGPPPARQPGLRIRWGRMVLAAVGLLCLLGAAVALALTVVGVPGWVPAVSAAVTAACVATLRSLAVRDRRRRVSEAFRDAIRANEAEPPVPVRPRVPNEVFDAGRGPEAPVKVMSREELRALALEVAKASQASAADAAKASGEPASDPWDPVEVPRPSYIDAAKAERPEPAPLEAPDQPKPEGRPILKPTPESPEPGTVPGVPGLDQRSAGRGALGNLDEVLQRRRA